MRTSSRAELALPGLAAALAAGLLLQGAFYGGQLAIVAGILAITVCAAGFSRGPGPPIASAFAIVAAGLLASAAANGWPGDAWKPAGTLLVAILVTVIARRAIETDGVEVVTDLCLAAAALVAVAGIVGVSLGIDGLMLSEHPRRLTSTLTYQNAAGALFALVLPAALVRAASGRAHARAAAVLTTTALAGTLSRGAILAAIVGLAVLLGARALDGATVARVALGSAVATGGLVAAMVEVPGAPAIALAASIAGVLLAVTRAQLRTRTILIGLSIAAVAGVLAVAVTPIRGRLEPTTTDRARVWRQTLDRVDEHLTFGTGPGTYELIAPKDGRVVRTRFVHNEYLQTLSETGVAGLIAVTAAMALMGAAVWRARRRDGYWAAAAAGCLGFAIQSGLDFLWRFPALVAFVSVLLAIATAESGEATANQADAWDSGTVA